ADITEEIERTHQMTVLQIIAANRHNFALHLTELTTSARASVVTWDLDRILTRVIPGVPILVTVMLLMLLTVFVAGGFFEGIIVSLCDTYLLIPAGALPLHPLIRVVLTSLLVAVQAGLGIAFPFVFIFSVLMALLEDSGYMTRAAFLADRAMHRVGMHGGAIIPLVLSFGCNVPAILATRTLRTRRERIIASFLTTLIPCSARTVIISGIVAVFIGIPQALSIYLIVILVTLATGVVLSRTLPGEQFGMMMELTTLRMPRAEQVLQKSWMRVREFLFIAMPLLLAGSLVLGLLAYAGVLALFQEALAPLSMGILGLPSYASTALLFGILRKELAFQTLAVLAGTATLNTVLTNTQLYTFALVSTLFVPCISTIAIMRRELGWKIAAAVSVYTIIAGIVIGAVARILFPLVFP
ncbi:MAG: ferrous iron transport protein B, partial [Methanomicrobiales archaeon]|nr:ferrous iron transport protein B [Methanomicrobiales archaeon]